MIGGGIPIGLRLPFGYFSLTIGSGIEVALISTTVWQGGTLGLNGSIATGGLWVPAWARLELEPGCPFGIFVQASYASTISDAPSYSSIGAGITFRGMRTCY